MRLLVGILVAVCLILFVVDFKAYSKPLKVKDSTYYYQEDIGLSGGVKWLPDIRVQ